MAKSCDLRINCWRSGLITIAMATMVLGEASALAQSQSDSNSKDELPREGLSDIIVTARKQSEKMQDIPVAVSAVGMQSLAELNITQADKLASLGV